MVEAPRVENVLLTVLLVAGLAGCGGYHLVGRAPAAREPEGRSIHVARPTRIAGDSIDLRESGCPLPPERTGFVVVTTIEKDGTIGPIEFTLGDPSDCIRAYVEKTLATWRFDVPTGDGQPATLHYSLTFSSP